MTKEEIMHLAWQYACLYMTFTEERAKQELSDAIDAALKKARRDALEEAAKRVEAWPFGDVAAAIRALKEKA